MNTQKPLEKLSDKQIEYIKTQTKASYQSDCFKQNFELYWQMSECLRAEEPWKGYWNAVKKIKEEVWEELSVDE